MVTTLLRPRLSLRHRSAVLYVAALVGFCGQLSGAAKVRTHLRKQTARKLASDGGGTPLRFVLSPQHTGPAATPDVYALEIDVGRSGPLKVLVDTGSAALVVKGVDEGAQSDGTTSGNSFIARGDSDEPGGSASSFARINYSGGSVSGEVRKTKVCMEHGLAVDNTTSADGGQQPEGGAENTNLERHVCLADFPVFEVDTSDAGFAALGLDGVLGLGPNPGDKSMGVQALDETLLDGLAAAPTPENFPTSMSRVFGIFTSPSGPLFGPSELTLGGFDASKVRPGADMRYVDLAQPSTGRWEIPLEDLRAIPADGGPEKSLNVCEGRKSDCRALIDSGTAHLEADQAVIDSLDTMLSDGNGGCSAPEKLPDLRIVFAGGATVRLGPEDYMDDANGCLPGTDALSDGQLKKDPARAMVLGQPFMRKVYSVFDQEHGRIGFAPSLAAPLQTRNQQRRSQGEAEKTEAFNTFINGGSSPAVG
eukprot:gnl/TRDRNA2_/TRDRNA2_37914_c0_seq1.p1 gnl/TRDRNA2_/TRDRNA2_37914_c0~~gnl/TRDRNA2_/TRDRNA2_37914_c0_seq1.p1  ORF type:complete len:478 (+),score=86.24 gnl/TRDRNA2_/TRDRNA2_37914_c0_seq1:68-1501(+)